MMLIFFKTLLKNIEVSKILNVFFLNTRNIFIIIYIVIKFTVQEENEAKFC